jgi:hypothetical protein
MWVYAAPMSTDTSYCCCFGVSVHYSQSPVLGGLRIMSILKLLLFIGYGPTSVYGILCNSKPLVFSG